jgi:hypothetical protein
MTFTCYRCTGTFEHLVGGGRPKYCSTCRPEVKREQRRAGYHRNKKLASRQCRYCSTVVYGNAHACEEHKGRLQIDANRRYLIRRAAGSVGTPPSPLAESECLMNLIRAMVWTCRHDEPCTSCTLDGMCIFSLVPGTPDYRKLNVIMNRY